MNRVCEVDKCDRAASFNVLVSWRLHRMALREAPFTLSLVACVEHAAAIVNDSYPKVKVSE